MAGCVFCGIAERRDAAEIVFEDEQCVAFLDHRPLFPGHCLLIPREHWETLADLPSRLVGPLFLNARRIARGVEVGMDAEGTFLAVNNRVSQSVPHLHVHIVPRRRKDGLKGFFWPRRKYQDDRDMRQVRDAVRAAIERVDPS
ncbi:MAG: HIT family protein [Planctomycetes bacterium]|nr:HIT family protein [Planctomycetota bacterium]